MPVETSNRWEALAWPVYPFRNRWRWLMFGRYSHLVRALRDDRRLLEDPTLDRRVANLRTWNFVRFVVTIPLSAGLLATVGSAIAALLPGGAAEDALGGLVAVVTGATGLLTLLYLFLTRLLGQLEIDILAILSSPRAPGNKIRISGT